MVRCLLGLLLIPSLSFAAKLDVSLGAAKHTVRYNMDASYIDEQSYSSYRAVVGGSVRHVVGSAQRNEIGAGVDVSYIEGARFVGLRALDYRYVITPKTAVGAFVGAATWQTGAPQNGYYLGAGVEVRDLWNGVGAGLDVTYADGLGRDRIPSDPPTDAPYPRPDIFADILTLNAKIIVSF